MSCFHPLTLYKNRLSGEVVYNRPKVDYDLWDEFPAPCGHCVGCRLDYAKQWSIRCQLEYETSGNVGCFVTLTYDDEHCPLSVSKRDCQLFFKRLRKAFPNRRIRYYLAAEYGPKSMRPHYHAVIFGVSPDDLLTKHKRSDILKKLWPFGFNYVGQLTSQSCAYCARYTLKKAGRSDFLQKIGLEKEFNLVSKGIGKDWFYSHLRQLRFDQGYFYLNGEKIRLNRYFLTKLQQEDPDLFTLIKANNEKLGKIYAPLVGDREVAEQNLKKRIVSLRRRLL